MISLIIPTRNRAKVLQITLPSFFSQKKISEIVFINDHGHDNTNTIIQKEARKHPSKSVKIITNMERIGAAHSRNLGVNQAQNEFILFCDDDEIMAPDYAKILYEKLVKKEAAAISGRRIYLLENESTDQAKKRFGKGLRKASFFNAFLLEYTNGAYFLEDLKVPFTNANILTKRSLCKRFPFDPFYSKGNGYREETDYQMNLYVNGFNIYITNDTHTFHLPLSEVRSGGQRVSKIQKVFWTNYFNYYFCKKYYKKYATRSFTKIPKAVSLFCFFLFSLYRETLRPFLYKIYIKKK